MRKEYGVYQMVAISGTVRRSLKNGSGHPGIERTKEHVRQYLGAIEGIHQHAWYTLIEGIISKNLGRF